MSTKLPLLNVLTTAFPLYIYPSYYDTALITLLHTLFLFITATYATMQVLHPANVPFTQGRDSIMTPARGGKIIAKIASKCKTFFGTGD